MDIEVFHLEGTIQLNPFAAKSKNTDYMHYLFWIRYFNAVLTRVVTDHMYRPTCACHTITNTVIIVMAIVYGLCYYELVFHKCYLRFIQTARKLEPGQAFFVYNLTFDLNF